MSVAPLPGGGRLADGEPGLSMTDPLEDSDLDRPEAERLERGLGRRDPEGAVAIRVAARGRGGGRWGWADGSGCPIERPPLAGGRGVPRR